MHGDPRSLACPRGLLLTAGAVLQSVPRSTLQQDKWTPARSVGTEKREGRTRPEVEAVSSRVDVAGRTVIWREGSRPALGQSANYLLMRLGRFASIVLAIS